MTTYKTFLLKGNKRYMRDGKLIAKDKVPLDIVEKLNESNIVNEDVEIKETSGKECIFCGNYAKYSKFINMQTIAICVDHYHSKSTGQIVQKINESKGP